MHTSLPALPSSLNTTMAVLATFAFVLARGATRGAANAQAAKAASDVRSKAQRLAIELQQALEIRDRAVKRIEALGPERPAAVTAATEELVATIDALLDGIDKSKRSTEMLLTALRAAEKHGAALEMMRRGWRVAARDLAASAAQLVADLDRDEVRAAAQSVAGQIAQMIQLSLAEQGLTEWARGLPSDDDDLVDLDDAKPVMWVPDHGWIES